MLRSRIDRQRSIGARAKQSGKVTLCLLVFVVLWSVRAELRAQDMPLLHVPPAQNAPVEQAVVRHSTTADVAKKPLPTQIVAMPGVQETLEVINRRSQLLVARHNIVRTAIADPSVIDIVQYSPNEISIIGLTLGSTTLTIWFDNSPDPLIYLVRTIRDPSIEDQKRIDYGRLERKLAVLFPNSKVYLIPLSGKIIVKGQARDSEEAARILQIVRGEVINQAGSLGGPQPAPATDIAGLQAQVINPLDLASTYIVNMLEVPGEYQVMLRVRIAELSRSQLRRLGIDFNYLINSGRHAISYSLGGIPSTLTGIFENNEISVLVDWLASNGTAKILAEPVLTVLSGHSASFLAGSEFAVPTIVGIGGAQGQQTSFRGTGTSIIVTPTVLDRDLVRMRIIPEFSSINNSNAVQGIPGVDSRRVQTTVELREGQTIAIAGLITHQTSTEVTRIPLLGEIPYFGSRLFSAKRTTQDQSELLILVSPEIVRPMDAEEVPPVPGFEVTHPNDWELYHAAMTEGVPDSGYYQLPPYGRGAGTGIDVGYRLFNPAPASAVYSPVPTDPYGAGSMMPAAPGAYGQQPFAQPQPQPQPELRLPVQPNPVTPPPAAVPIPQRQNSSPQPQAYRSPRKLSPARWSLPSRQPTQSTGGPWFPVRGRVTPTNYAQQKPQAQSATRQSKFPRFPRGRRQ